jgi:hypothetical protein
MHKGQPKGKENGEKRNKNCHIARENIKNIFLRIGEYGFWIDI